MKKFLMGTTAIATAALLSTAAHAADDGLKLSLSGWYSGVVMAGSDGHSDTHDVTFEGWNGEIHFDAEATAANGLTYGFHIELEGTSQGDQIDESYLYLQGSFGKIILGADDPASAAMSYVSPSPDKNGILTVNSGDYTFGYTALTYNSDGDNQKLIYFTPRVAGFQLGLSYSPDGTEDITRGNVQGGFELDNDGAGQQFTAGLNFSKEFSGVSVGVSATYAYLEDEIGGNDQNTYGLGANLGFGIGAGTLTVGTSWLRTEDFGFSNEDVDAFDAGVQYAAGPWTVGVQSIWSDDVDFLGSGDDVWGLSVGGGYTVATGFDLAIGYIHYETDAWGIPAPGKGGTVDAFVLGTMLSF